MDKNRALNDDLDPEQLAMPAGFYSPDATASIPRRDFGDPGTWEPAPARPDYSVCDKTVNRFIYEGMVVHGIGIGTPVLRERQMARMMPLFGFTTARACEDWLCTHGKGDPQAVELLLSDAMATGKWKELPGALQPEYHRRKGAAV